MKIFLAGFALGVTLFWSPTFKASPSEYGPIQIPERKREVGVASWYGEKFHGRTTASGEVYDMNGLTAAHRNLPLGTLVQVTNLRNQRSVTVRINDRGPSILNRQIDVSKSAAQALGFVGAGLATVRMEVVSPPAAGRQPLLTNPRIRENVQSQSIPRGRVNY